MIGAAPARRRPHRRAAVVLGEDHFHRLLEHRARRSRFRFHPFREFVGVHAEECRKVVAPAAQHFALLQDAGAHLCPARLLFHGQADSAGRSGFYSVCLFTQSAVFCAVFLVNLTARLAVFSVNLAARVAVFSTNLPARLAVFSGSAAWTDPTAMAAASVVAVIRQKIAAATTETLPMLPAPPI